MGGVAKSVSGVLGGGDDGPTQQSQAATDAQNSLLSKTSALQSQADKYRTAIPENEQEQSAAAEDSGRRQLASTMTGIDRGSNSRGLLYSGLNQGAKSNATGQAVAGLSAARAGINNSVNSQADSMNLSATQAGLTNQSMAEQAAQAQYQSDLAKQQSQQGLLGSGLGGLGSFAGAAFAKK